MKHGQSAVNRDKLCMKSIEIIWNPSVFHQSSTCWLMFVGSRSAEKSLQDAAFQVADLSRQLEATQAEKRCKIFHLKDLIQWTITYPKNIQISKNSFEKDWNLWSKNALAFLALFRKDGLFLSHWNAIVDRRPRWADKASLTQLWYFLRSVRMFRAVTLGSNWSNFEFAEGYWEFDGLKQPSLSLKVSGAYAPQSPEVRKTEYGIVGEVVQAFGNKFVAYFHLRSFKYVYICLCIYYMWN